MLIYYQLSHYLLWLLSDNSVLLMNAANTHFQMFMFINSGFFFVLKCLHESDKLIIYKAALKKSRQAATEQNFFKTL